MWVASFSDFFKVLTVNLQRNTKIVIFSLPVIFFYLMFMTLTLLPWYTGVILVIAEFFGMHHVCTPLLFCVLPD